MKEKILSICLLGLLVYALWKRIRPAMRSEIDRSMRIAAVVLLLGAATALFFQVY